MVLVCLLFLIILGVMYFFVLIKEFVWKLVMYDLVLMVGSDVELVLFFFRIIVGLLLGLDCFDKLKFESMIWLD